MTSQTVSTSKESSGLTVVVSVAAELTTGEDVLKGFAKRSLGIHLVRLGKRSSGSYCVPNSLATGIYFKITQIILGFCILSIRDRHQIICHML